MESHTQGRWRATHRAGGEPHTGQVESHTQGRWRATHRASGEPHTGQVESHTQGRWRATHRAGGEPHTGQVESHTQGRWRAEFYCHTWLFLGVFLKSTLHSEFIHCTAMIYLNTEREEKVCQHFDSLNLVDEGRL